jgi:hypothetical protein
METKPQTSREYFRALQIIFYALIAGQVSFALVSVFLNQMSDFSSGTEDLRKIFLIIVPVFVIGGYLGSRFLFKNNLKTARSRESLTEKMNDYRAACVVRYALLEGPSFLAIITFLLTGDYVFLGITGFIIAIFLTIIPSQDKAVFELELNPYEEQKIRDPDAVISELKLNK